MGSIFFHEEIIYIYITESEFFMRLYHEGSASVVLCNK